MVGMVTNVCGNTLINSELLRYKKCVRFQTVNRSQRTGSDAALRCQTHRMAEPREIHPARDPTPRNGVAPGVSMGLIYAYLMALSGLYG